MLYHYTLRLVIKKTAFFKISANLKSVIYPSLSRNFSYFAFKKIKKNLVVFKKLCAFAEENNKKSS